MSAKKSRNYTPKGYIPEARDGDGDGLVQDGTEFERPVGTEWTFEEVTEEPAEEPVEIPVENPGLHTVQEGENIQTIAELYKPEGMTRQDYAKELFAKNGNFYPGKTIRL